MEICKFCVPELEESINETKVEFGVLGDATVYTYIDVGNNLVTEFYHMLNTERKAVKINYCPMCGRKLG